MDLVKKVQVYTTGLGAGAAKETSKIIQISMQQLFQNLYKSLDLIFLHILTLNMWDLSVESCIDMYQNILRMWKGNKILH